MSFDSIILIPILALILLIFWFSHREIQKSFLKTKRSEQTLRQEKIQLLDKMEEQGEELRKSRAERIQELSKVAEFGRLSQGLLHDLMTPLTSIILNTEELKNNSLNDINTTYKNLEKAIDASKRMAAYIQNIKSNWRMSGNDKILNLNEELKEVLDLLSFKIKTENINLEIKPVEKITYFGDMIKIRQVFSNLILNAIDSFGESNKNNREIILSLFKDKNNIAFEIKDNGQGITKENMEKIFNPFFTTKSIDKGTGIGLSTVKSIVEKNLLGKIEVESTITKGSSFKIIFPLDRNQGII